jgi:hypothetical protein
MKLKIKKTEVIFLILLLIAVVWLLLMSVRYNQLVGEYNELQREKYTTERYGPPPIYNIPDNYSEVENIWINPKR